MPLDDITLKMKKKIEKNQLNLICREYQARSVNERKGFDNL